MTFIRTVDEAEARGTVARIYDQSLRDGGLYETTRSLSPWPEAMAIERRRYQTVMVDESRLTRAEKELIAVAVSAANRCRYCLVHHAAMAIEAGADRATVDAVAADPRGSRLAPRLRAMLDFALTERPDQAAREDVDGLRATGFDDRQVLEIVLVAGLFRDYNFRVSMLGLELEPWFADARR